MAFDTPEEIRLHASKIEQQTVLSKIMPLGNTTDMTDEERQSSARGSRRGREFVKMTPTRCVGESDGIGS